MGGGLLTRSFEEKTLKKTNCWFIFILSLIVTKPYRTQGPLAATSGRNILGFVIHITPRVLSGHFVLGNGRRSDDDDDVEKQADDTTGRRKRDNERRKRERRREITAQEE